MILKKKNLQKQLQRGFFFKCLKAKQRSSWNIFLEYEPLRVSYFSGFLMATVSTSKYPPKKISVIEGKNRIL